MLSLKNVCTKCHSFSMGDCRPHISSICNSGAGALFQVCHNDGDKVAVWFAHLTFA